MSQSSLKIESENDTNESVEYLDSLRNFIETYEKLPILWDPSDLNYTNKIRRAVALDELKSIYLKIKPGATRVDVRRKINTLRCNYRKELRKIIASKMSNVEGNDVYQPNSWVFYALQFLGRIDRPVTVPSKQIRDEETDVEEVKDQPAISPYVKKKRRSTIPIGLQNKLLRKEFLEKACSFLESSTNSNDNEIPTIVILWGEKLVSLDAQQRVFAEKAINDVLFEASLGTLNRYSVRINENQAGPSTAPSSLTS